MLPFPCDTLFLVGFFLIQSTHMPEHAKSSRWHIKELQQNFLSHNIYFEKKMLVSKNIDKKCDR